MKKLMIIILVLLIANIAFTAGEKYSAIKFTRIFKCDEKSDRICVIGGFDMNLPLVLLAEYSSETCKGVTDERFYYNDEMFNFDATSIKVPMECLNLQKFSLAIVNIKKVKYTLRSTTEVTNQQVKNLVINYIKTHKRYMKEMETRTVSGPIYMKGVKTDLEISDSIKIFSSPFEENRFYLAKIHYIRTLNGKYLTEAEPFFYVYGNKVTQLAGDCAQSPSFFKINSKSYVKYGYSGCNSGIVGVAIYDVSGQTPILVYDDATWST
jgi:hypothetical protein